MEGWSDNSLWVGLALWASLVAAEYCLWILIQRQYARDSARQVTFEGGLDLNPLFYGKTGRQLRIGARLLAVFIAFGLLIALAWYGSRNPVMTEWTAKGVTRHYYARWLYPFVLGACVLWRLVSTLGLVQSLLAMRGLAKSGAVEGRLWISRLYSLRQAGVQHLSFGVLFGLLGFALGSPFLLGGSVTCGLSGLRALLAERTSRRSNSLPPPPDAMTVERPAPASSGQRSGIVE